MVAHFQFVMRSGPNTGKIYPLELSEISIGREASNDIAINDGEISRKHAKMTLHGTTYLIQDLGSTNGTSINGQRITGSQVLNPGDTVSFGENIVMLYEATLDPNATIIASAQSPKTVIPVQKPTPISAPVPPTVPAPAPARPFYNQVSASTAPSAPAPAKKKFPFWLIILIVLLLMICACLAFFIIIDQLSLWCNVVPFLVPLLGGTCG
jgi:predicted component of type VI protein secretion system